MISFNFFNQIYNCSECLLGHKFPGVEGCFLTQRPQSGICVCRIPAVIEEVFTVSGVKFVFVFCPVCGCQSTLYDYRRND
jgi:hypothetical protein